MSRSLLSELRARKFPSARSEEIPELFIVLKLQRSRVHQLRVFLGSERV